MNGAIEIATAADLVLAGAGGAVGPLDVGNAVPIDFNAFELDGDDGNIAGPKTIELRGGSALPIDDDAPYLIVVSYLATVDTDIAYFDVEGVTVGSLAGPTGESTRVGSFLLAAGQDANVGLITSGFRVTNLIAIPVSQPD